MNEGEESSASEPVLGAYFANITKQRPSFVNRLFGKRPKLKRSFDHLIVHSDAEGFYLPADFAAVLFPPDDLEIPGAMIGSAPRLPAELDRVAAALEIPGTFTSQSPELWEAVESQGKGDKTWQRFGIESMCCVTLRQGCRESIRTGAALVFT